MNSLPAICLLVPSFQPGDELLQVVREFRAACADPIVVVNDGSSAEHAAIFSQLTKVSDLRICSHATNRGKGAALKSGFRLRSQLPHCLGFLCVDADGQHPTRDVLRLRAAALSDPSALYLGVRSFSGSKIPLRSRLGNLVTRWFFGFLTGRHVEDTQTGLRFVPMGLVDDLLGISADRYDFEMSALARLAMNRPLKFVQIPIETLYFNANSNSHFRPLVDSFKIYRSFLTAWVGARGKKSV